MSAQVTAAVVSGGVALVVAVLGIAGAIAAQIFATRRAFGNSLALFERQHANQERERQEQARREDAYRFAEQRRSTYGRLLRLASELADARCRAALADSQLMGGEWNRRNEEARRVPQESAGQRELPDAEAAQAVEEVRLLASADVRRAAEQLWREVQWVPRLRYRGRPGSAPVLGDPMDKYRQWHDCYEAARAAFLEAARRELGVDGDVQSAS